MVKQVKFRARSFSTTFILLSVQLLNWVKQSHFNPCYSPYTVVSLFCYHNTLCELNIFLPRNFLFPPSPVAEFLTAYRSPFYLNYVRMKIYSAWMVAYVRPQITDYSRCYRLCVHLKRCSLCPAAEKHGPTNQVTLKPLVLYSYCFCSTTDGRNVNLTVLKIVCRLASVALTRLYGQKSVNLHSTKSWI